MKRLSPKLLLALLSLALVALVFVLDLRSTSPGPLSPVHAQVPELAGAGGCPLCHELDRAMASACADCHRAILDSIEAGRGLHGTLAGRDVRACATCHVEHHGAEVELAGARAFALAGVAERERYDHAALGFRLEGAHLALACSRCHARAEAPLLERGQPRFLGLEQDCASCHADPHEGRMARACADCHGQSEPFAVVAEFDHRDAFVSAGAHARARCQDCHAPESPRSVETLGGDAPQPPRRTCAECHASPHAEDFVAGFARERSLAAGESCLACHDPAAGPFRAPGIPEGVAWHAASGFPLAGPHAALACEACHADSSGAASAASAIQPLRPRSDPSTAPSPSTFPAFAQRYLARTPDDCAACHADPHRGAFGGRELGRGGCLACHEREHFAPARFGAEQHARTAFPLDGAHLAADCARCHARDASAPREPADFSAAPTACAGCHADAHDGVFARPELLAKLPALAERSCAACHDALRFDHGARERFDHGAFTAFALEGAHRKARCEACHVPAATRDERGRKFGRAAAPFDGRPNRCSDCHADAHDGLFDARASDAQREASCARCHVATDFAVGARARFDHGADAGFPLVGAHARAACETCHEPLERPTREGRRLARASARFGYATERCDACHADPHQGRFARTPEAAAASVGAAEGCARCHSQDAFRPVDPRRFEHGTWTGFELRGAHSGTACAACHAPRPAPGAPARGLGPAPGNDCESCHADPHAGQFSQGNAAGCARCHAEDAPFREPRFDHQRDARFALDATHAKLACSACHVPHALAGGRSVVRYRPLGVSCADCHGGSRGAGKDG